ncbi:MAG: hypothetical protein COU28_01210 [Candidatus Magasanikbacteria bacterium CG10_big_fil_rev_8_21_14_0_10_36_16]|uniref:Uncharacterized protein n=1 Tax=Candidatus Magasanikbacteria bacterium CG10_big_fil_rev_8_21_14_0_10_36_16 TaxID=1974645 RepID=A0A2H0U1E7_9BACT|nr:MAG: hypothetical protein COU28_01210 [Candidatus Magasanikbacteria bacterium CG10_big_fil_rev_8_21_14_0_10_36_16]
MVQSSIIKVPLRRTIGGQRFQVPVRGTWTSLVGCLPETIDDQAAAIFFTKENGTASKHLAKLTRPTGLTRLTN